jgi:hypothetical protein
VIPPSEHVLERERAALAEQGEIDASESLSRWYLAACVSMSQPIQTAFSCARADSVRTHATRCSMRCSGPGTATTRAGRCASSARFVCCFVSFVSGPLLARHDGLERRDGYDQQGGDQCGRRDDAQTYRAAIAQRIEHREQAPFEARTPRERHRAQRRLP